MKKFSHNKQRINPGDEVPNDISEAAMESLIKKGVLKALKE